MISKNKQILLVEDDVNFGTVLRDYLQMNGYKVVLARNGLEGFEKFKKNEFDVCILDVMMPYKDGFTLAKEIRSKDKSIPVVFLTAKSMKDDVLKGYKIGADDYLTKPFFPKELEMRMRSILRRSISVRPVQQIKRESAQKIFKFGNTIVDLNKQEIWKGNLKITLTTLEWKILNLLIDNAGVE
ncbi:MAG: response regulator transcription factor, partial [Flavobacteriaceae bacterium]